MSVKRKCKLEVSPRKGYYKRKSNTEETSTVVK